MTNNELALLGLVAEKPKHGYQVELDIEERGMREWTEIGFSSIYYILNKLEGAGWLASEKQESPDRPSRKVYQITKAGQQALHDGVLERLSHPQPRSGDFDLALSNLTVLSSDEINAAIQVYCSQLTQRYTQVKTKWEIQSQNGLPHHVHLLFDHSLAAISAELTWIDQNFS